MDVVAWSVYSVSYYGMFVSLKMDLSVNMGCWGRKIRKGGRGFVRRGGWCLGFFLATCGKCMGCLLCWRWCVGCKGDMWKEQGL